MRRFVAQRDSVSVDGRKVRFRVAGAGRPVVLLHGLSGSSHWWDRNVEPLSRHFQVFTVDLPAFGNNRRWDEFVLSDAAAHIIAWMDAANLVRPSLVGHSMGGWIAADLASRWPERADCLLLADAPLLPDPRGLFRIATAGVAAARMLPPRFVPMLIGDALRAGVLTLRNAGLDVHRADLRRRLVDISAPRLVVWGEHDRLLPLDYGRRVAAAVGAELRIVRGAGHNPMWDRPENFNAITLEFLTLHATDLNP